MSVTHFVNDMKVAWLTAVGTVGTGLGTILEAIPDDIGKLATLVGIVLSSVLIRSHWRKDRIEYKKTRLEISILKKKEAERVKAVIRRNRRKED